MWSLTCRACSRSLASRVGVLLAVRGVEERGQRHFGVHHDVLATRELDDDVRCQAAIFSEHRLLQLVMIAFDHAGVFEHASELELAPLAADVGGS